MQQEFMRKLTNARDAAIALNISSTMLASTLSHIIEGFREGNSQEYMTKYGADLNKSLEAVTSSSALLYKALEAVSGISDE